MPRITSPQRLARVPCPFAAHFEKWPQLLRAIADTLREYCIALSSKGQGTLVPVNCKPPPASFEGECHAVNPYSVWPPDDTWKSMASRRVTFTNQVLKWIAELRWPLVPDERPVTWAELLISFRLYSGMRLPVAHPRNRHIYLTPGIHRIHAQGSRTLRTDIWSFKNALNTISSVVSQDLLPWNQAEKQCNTALVLGAKVKASGFGLRPNLQPPVSGHCNHLFATILCNPTRQTRH